MASGRPEGTEAALTRYCWTCGSAVTRPPCPVCGDRRTFSDKQLQQLGLAHLRGVPVDREPRPRL